MAKQKLIVKDGRTLKVDESGNVWNADTDNRLHPLTNQITGYQMVSVWNRDTKKAMTFLVHRLVAEAFIPNPNNLPQVNHKNHNRSDNRASNLEWVDRKTNNSTRHARRMKRKNYKSIKHPDHVVMAENGNQVMFFYNANQAARGIGCSEPMAVRSLNRPQGADWKAKGWRLTYIDKTDPRCAEFIKEHSIKVEERKFNSKKATMKRALKKNRNIRKEHVRRIEGMIETMHYMVKEMRRTSKARATSRIPNLDMKRMEFNDLKRVVVNDRGEEFPNVHQASIQCGLSEYALYAALGMNEDSMLGSEWVEIDGGTKWKYKLDLTMKERELAEGIRRLEHGQNV